MALPRPLTMRFLLRFGILAGLVVCATESLLGIVAGNYVSAADLLIFLMIYALIGLLSTFCITGALSVLRRSMFPAIRPLTWSTLQLAVITFLFTFTPMCIIVNKRYLVGNIIHPTDLGVNGLVLLLFYLVPVVLHLRFLRGFRISILPGYFLLVQFISTVFVGMYQYRLTAVRGIYNDESHVFLHLTVMFVLFLAGIAAALVILKTGFFFPRISRVLKRPAISTFVLCGLVVGLEAISGAGFPARSPVSAAAAVREHDDTRPNIILIVLDTMRADYLSCYGYPRETSPHLDAFADEYLLFKHCFSNSNTSLTSHASLLSGMHVSTHGAHFPRNDMDDMTSVGMPLHNDVVTIAEVLQKARYTTGAVVSNPIYVTRAFGMHQGFEFWYNTSRLSYEPPFVTFLLQAHSGIPRWLRMPIYLRAEEINTVALDWLPAQRKAPFFLFLNYFDPHVPLCPPRPTYHQFAEGRTISAQHHLIGLDALALSRDYPVNLTPSEYNWLLSSYEGEIAYMDRQLGQLFRRLREEDLWDNSLIIVTGDHGEFFGEKGWLGHNVTLYNPVVHVPLLVKLPAGSGFSADPSQPVSIMDLYSTILEAADASAPVPGEGTSLFSSGDRRVLLEGYKMKHRDFQSLVRGSYKFTLERNHESGAETERRELFHLDDDPYEDRNLVSTYPAIADSMYAELTRLIGSIQRGNSTAGTPVLSPQERRTLRSLGYIDD